MRITSVLLLILAVAAAELASSSPASALTETPPNFKVAFIGDSGTGGNFNMVLNLIASEGADMVIHSGDMGYGNEADPQVAINWDAQITNVLGNDFPYFASTGNHDVTSWATYQQLLEDRLALVSGASCTGDYGVMAACTYQGLFFILSGAGSQPNTPNHQPHIDYLQNALAADDSVWRICDWHKNQTAMQLGDKTNEVGWGPYEVCRQGRAIIATAHEHSYQRTRTLSNIQTQTTDPAWPESDLLRVSEGSTFVFVSGLGGNSIRNQDRCLPTTPPYGCNGEWARVSTSDQGANFGALFIEFNVDGNPYKANGYFKEIDGDIVDTFTIFSQPEGVGGVTELPAVSPVAPVAAAEPTPDDSGSAYPLLLGGAAAAIVLTGAAWFVGRRWAKRRA